MKKPFMISLLATLCITAAGQLAISRYTMDGGGGKSTGGTLALQGTIGQPDASPQYPSAGPLTLSGGFWSVIAVQTEGTPYLSISNQAPGQVTLFWDPASVGWTLQESPGLAPAGWVNSPSGSTNPVSVPTSTTNLFYRLFKP